MEIRFSQHAREQLAERNMTESEIRYAITHAERVTKQSSGRYLAIRRIRKQSKAYLLVVIFEEHHRRKEIITAFITSKFKKYL